MVVYPNRFPSSSLSNSRGKLIAIGLVTLAMTLSASPHNPLAGIISENLTYQLSSVTAFTGDSCASLGDPSETLNIDFSVKWEFPSDTIGIIDMRFTYDPTVLLFERGLFDSAAWKGLSSIESSVAGVIELHLKVGSLVTTGDFQTVANFEFSTLCRSSAFIADLAITVSEDQNEVYFIGPFNLDYSPTNSQKLDGSITIQAALRDPCCVVSGDVDGNGSLGIGDVTSLIGYIFGGAPAPTCCSAADINFDGRISIADVTSAISRIFSGGAAPSCGPMGISCN